MMGLLVGGDPVENERLSQLPDAASARSASRHCEARWVGAMACSRLRNRHSFVASRPWCAAVRWKPRKRSARSQGRRLNSRATAPVSMFSTAWRSFGRQESLSNYREIGDSLGIAWSFNNLGLVATALQEHDEAQRLHEQALTLYEKIGDRQNIVFTLNNLGMVGTARGDYEAARSLHASALSKLSDVGANEGSRSFWRTWPFWPLSAARPSARYAIASAAGKLRPELSAAPPPAWEAELKRRLEPARETLSEDVRAATEAEGRALTIERAVEYALASLPNSG